MAKQVALMNLPEVRLLEDITRESAARLIEELSQFKGRPVALSIFSNGGDVHGSQAVAAYISAPANDMQVEARIYGNAASGAMIIAAACQRAYIAAGAFALVHKAAAIGADGKRIPEKDLPKEEVAVLDAMNADQVALFQKRTGKTAASIEKLMEQDRDMPADEAVDLGFFDGLIPQAARLAAFKQINMADEKKMRTLKVSREAAAMAVISGTLDVPETELKAADDAKIATLEADIAAKTTELATLKAAKEATDAAKTAAETDKATADADKAKAEAELVTAKAETAKYVAVIDALKKNPLVAQVMPDGTSVVVPGDTPGDTKKVDLSPRAIHAQQSNNAWEAAKKRAYDKQTA